MAGSGAKIAIVGVISFLVVVVVLFLILIVIFRRRADNCYRTNFGENMACPQTYCGSEAYNPPGSFDD